MSKQKGNIRKFLSRLFKERQIYHRSGDVVHYISMSSKTQIALAMVLGGAFLWMAYASVNVVFKEQIIVAKDRDARITKYALNESRVQTIKILDQYASEKLLLTSRLAKFCDQIECTPEQFSYLVTGESDFRVKLKCRSNRQSQIVCEDLSINRIQDLNQTLEDMYASLNTFYDNIATATLFVIAKFTGGEDIWKDPEYVKEARIAILRTVLGSIGAILVLIITLILRAILGHSRAATVEDLEKLKEDIAKSK